MFKFNKNYKDLKQVEQYYQQFRKIYDSIIEQDEHPYNSCFVGKIKGIEGEDEGTAIYLLQQLGTDINRNKKIEELKSQGFKEITDLEKTQKFGNIVIVGTNYSRDSTKEFVKARIFEEEKGNFFILPKGHSNRGLRIHSCEQKIILAK